MPVKTPEKYTKSRFCIFFALVFEEKIYTGYRSDGSYPKRFKIVRKGIRKRKTLYLLPLFSSIWDNAVHYSLSCYNF